MKELKRKEIPDQMFVQFFNCFEINDNNNDSDLREIY